MVFEIKIKSPFSKILHFKMFKTVGRPIFTYALVGNSKAPA